MDEESEVDTNVIFDWKPEHTLASAETIERWRKRGLIKTVRVRYLDTHADDLLSMVIKVLDQRKPSRDAYMTWDQFNYARALYGTAPSVEIPALVALFKDETL